MAMPKVTLDTPPRPKPHEPYPTPGSRSAAVTGLRRKRSSSPSPSVGPSSRRLAPGARHGVKVEPSDEEDLGEDEDESTEDESDGGRTCDSDVKPKVEAGSVRSESESDDDGEPAEDYILEFGPFAGHALSTVPYRAVAEYIRPYSNLMNTFPDFKAAVYANGSVVKDADGYLVKGTIPLAVDSPWVDEVPEGFRVPENARRFRTAWGGEVWISAVDIYNHFWIELETLMEARSKGSMRMRLPEVGTNTSQWYLTEVFALAQAIPDLEHHPSYPTFEDALKSFLNKVPC